MTGVQVYSMIAASTEEEAKVRFHENMAKYNYIPEDLPIERVELYSRSDRDKSKATFKVFYTNLKAGSAKTAKMIDLPNSGACGACEAWDPRKGCGEGSRPGTCGHSAKLSMAPLPSSQHAETIVPNDSHHKEHDDGDHKQRSSLDPSEIEVSKILITGWNPRKRFDDKALLELASSIMDLGLLEPILVRPKGSKYELVVGERRFRAVKDKLRYPTIATIVREMTDEQVLDAMIAENVCREDLNPIEEANHLKRVLEVGKLTQTELARRVGKSQEWVSRRIHLTEAPADLQQRIISRLISVDAAEELLRSKGEDHYQETLDEILERTNDLDEEERLTRGEVRAIIKAHETPEPEPPDAPEDEATALDAQPVSTPVYTDGYTDGYTAPEPAPPETPPETTEKTIAEVTDERRIITWEQFRKGGRTIDDWESLEKEAA